LTEASPGREIFTEMLDNQYAGMHAKSPLESGDQGLKNAISGISNSMAAQIYRSLARKEGATLPSPAAPSGKNTNPIIDADATKVEDLFSTAPILAKMVNSRARSGQSSKPAPITEDKLNPIVDLASKTYGVAANLIKSVIKTESANQPLAVSGAGAKGLMQLMDSTARDMGVRNVFNAHENVLAGTRYLKGLLQRFDGNEEKALAAYNAGPSVVDRFGGIPPYQETQDYVKKVLKNKSELDAAAAVD
jgi:soluble lytic murein transglycosylase-like protein